MSRAIARAVSSGAGVVTVMCAVLVAAHARSPDFVSAEAAFLADNQAAMSKMMAEMSIKPTGEVDRDFAAMMIPHHQGAIDMAKSELLYGRNERLRRIAQEIVIDQQQEIVAMRLAINQFSQPPSDSNAHVHQ